MRVILDMVVSVNGIIAKEDGSEDWLPHEGWEDMLAEVAKYDNIVLGRETYELVMKNYAEGNFNDVHCACKVIVTRDENYAAPAPYIVVHSPQEALEVLNEHGIHTCYLIGGGKLNGSFLAAGLINEIQLTICPYVLTKGRPVFGDVDAEANLKLIASEQKSLGRIYNRYQVKKEDS